ncbi:hypothetical protein VLK31_35980 [Variovorax sp. H27-G14]|uniref:hypothetical protein n=1 Tax=Variovorax sp. H27-G14 TaxID=3111914 RepID=UPI0038FC901F
MLLYMLWLFCNRLAEWTARKVEWPKDIKDVLGPVIRALDLRRETHRTLQPEEKV